MINKFFNKKKVLITGHNGFKGSWLTLWMNLIGADVLGLSNGIITKPSNFETLNLKKKIKSKVIDVTDYYALKKQIVSFKPDFIFHLAAEAIVKRSFKEPKKTWETNTLGTLNILQILKDYKNKVTVVLVTSDKVYKNKETSKGYLEIDELGNFDPYSASKASTDLAIQSYFRSFLVKRKNIRLGIARAGNVIGGGDWAEGRLIPDCIKCWSKKKYVLLRNPNSTRPWQYVLDVLYGYILLSINLKKNNKINGHIFNFGPKIEKNSEVKKIVKQMSLSWGEAKWKIDKKKNFYETKLLHLNSNKAKKILNWSCVFNLKETISYTIDWYKNYYTKVNNIYDFSVNQIKQYKVLL